MTLPVALALLPSAAAQGLLTHHPVVPYAGIAAENGPGTLWVNPANMGYDPDARFGVFLTRDPLTDGTTSLGAAVGAGGLSLGVHNHLRRVGDAFESDWSLDYGTSLRLPERLSLGLLLSWNFVQGDAPNYLAADLGVAWRPLPWLGVAGVAQNVGGPDPSGLAAPKTGAGIALRPLGSVAVLGLDYARLFGVPLEAPDGLVVANEDRLAATLRLRPIEGLYLRGGLEGRLADGGFQPVTVGAGVELFFDGVGLGGYGSSSLDALGASSAFVGTDEPGESLLRSGRRVPELELDQAPPYQRRFGLFGDAVPTWLDVLELLRRTEDDRGVKGLLLTLDGASLPLSRCKELRDRILELEAKGRPVLVYLTGSPSNGDLYVASAASRVLMHPAAELDLVGLSLELTHLRGLLDLVGVEPQFVKRADYKTAPEQWTETEPSGANLEMMNALLDDLYDDLVATIAEGRDVEPTVVQGWIDGGPHSADEALEAGMIDGLVYPDELEDELGRLHEGSITKTDLLDAPRPHSAWEDPQQIAIVYVEGAIVPGKSSPGGLFSGRVTGSESTVEALERARRDPQVRAVVIRVDSPGGSAFASDEIWRATERLGEAGKPVVVSMGSVAASGGYYVAAGADAIWAEPNTLTGSIGVFSGKFATNELTERIGVDTTVLARGRNAAIRSGSTPWDDLQRARMQELVDHTYRQFKERVLEGRTALDEQRLEEVARGRVWSGRKAHELHLVDQLGGFQDAIADARERAGIPARRKVGLVEFTPSGDLFQSLAPTILSTVFGPLPELLAREPRIDARELEALETLVGPLDTLLVPALHPDVDVWAMDPFLLEVEGE